jgi:hypothetical protein
MPSHACIPFIDSQGIERTTPKGKPIFAAVLRCAVKTRRRNGCRLDTVAAQKTIKTSIRLATHELRHGFRHQADRRTQTKSSQLRSTMHQSGEARGRRPWQRSEAGEFIGKPEVY